jgi:poly-gamma-glutamate synthesis protein (capsule biosynthesis protein)
MIGPYHPLDAEEPGFARVAALFQSADLGFANQEGSIFDLKTFTGFPAAETGGGYPLQGEAAAPAIRAMGVRLVSKANNHATDWGPEGLAATLRALAEAGVVEAGAGLSLSAARAPAYVAAGKATAALVATASTFPPMAVAGEAVERRGLISEPRPGLSPLHVRLVRLVPPARLLQLQGLSGAAPGGPGELRIGDVVYRAAATEGGVWEMQPSDEAAILAAIRQARTKADVVVFAIHAHETAGDMDPSPPAPFEPMVLHRANEAPSPDDPAPAGFEPALFHAAVDAGADIVIRTGPHAIGGVEIYKGRPIFYSLGSLFFDFGGRRRFTSPGGETLTFPDAWFESVVPVVVFKGGGLSEIQLHPIMIQPDGVQSGVPHPADHLQARAILDRLKTLSAAFGATVTIEGDLGRIRPNGACRRGQVAKGGDFAPARAPSRP